ncbi:MAG: hypothetical protein JO275_14050 [Verrucomicrobia bacterium]|nr:hypothetical protein [Verrucomicrobiota bacterium]
MKDRDVGSTIAGIKGDRISRDDTIREMRELEKALTRVLSNALSQWKSRHPGQLELVGDVDAVLPVALDEFARRHPLLLMRTAFQSRFATLQNLSDRETE